MYMCVCMYIREAPKGVQKKPSPWAEDQQGRLSKEAKRPEEPQYEEIIPIHDQQTTNLQGNDKVEIFEKQCICILKIHITTKVLLRIHQGKLRLHQGLVL